MVQIIQLIYLLNKDKNECYFVDSVDHHLLLSSLTLLYRNIALLKHFTTHSAVDITYK